MRSWPTGLIALLALAPFGIAHAADMPIKAPSAPVTATIYSWAGFYFGGNGGYGWKDPSVTFSPNDGNAAASTCFGGPPPIGTCAAPASFNINGPLGGLQAGYNWQFDQHWLLGFETDFDLSRIRGTGISNFSLSGFPANFTASENVTSFGTVRARLGFLPMNNILLFGTAGFAYGHVDENVALNSVAGNGGGSLTFGYNCVGGPNCFVGSSSRMATGWTAGGGLEYAVWQNISVKVEYLYVNLGKGNTVDVVSVAPNVPSNDLNDFQNESNTSLRSARLADTRYF